MEEQNSGPPVLDCATDGLAKKNSALANDIRTQYPVVLFCYFVNSVMTANEPLPFKKLERIREVAIVAY